MSERDEPLESQSWYRVGALKPSLRAHARVHRHTYRDALWYVLEDTSSGQCHRLSADAWALVGLMDGRRTLQEIWDAVQTREGERAPTQDETIRLLGRMHAADLIACDLPPDGAEIFERRVRAERRRWLQRLAQPLAIRLPLLDPDAFLTRWMPLVRPLFGWPGLMVWTLVVLAGAVLAASHWDELTADLTDRVLSADNLVLLWLAYPPIKVLHELGHGFAVKRWGGEVHEMGIMLLVLMPVPYVEASAASAFPDKRQRMAVGAAGIMVELFLAAVALLLWLAMEPGTGRALAYNVMVIGGLSTLIFNGNPLLRFDGYYVFCDLIEMPNLASRSQRYLLYLIQRWLLGARDAEPPQASAGERAWLLAYGIASFAYRQLVLLAIVLLVAGRFFVVGVLLALWAVAAQILWPLLKGVQFVLTSPLLDRHRARSTLGTLAAGAVLVLAALLLPLPSWTRTEGVVWLPERARVRAQADGTVSRLLVPDGSRVAAGDPLIESADPDLDLQVVLLGARLRELEARLDQAQFDDRPAARVLREEIALARADLARARERRAGLVLRSPTDGRFVVPGAADLPGRYLRRGALVAYVIPDDAQWSVRAVVDQDRIALVRGRTLGVSAMLADWHARPVPTRILREVPLATGQLPAAALGTGGGGDLALDPRDPRGETILQRVFVVDLALPDGLAGAYPGQRVAVRFDHGAEPLAFQWYRRLRQLFLARFGV